jgi:hypothetical protein
VITASPTVIVIGVAAPAGAVSDPAEDGLGGAGDRLPVVAGEVVAVGKVVAVADAVFELPPELFVEHAASTIAAAAAVSSAGILFMIGPDCCVV